MRILIVKLSSIGDVIQTLPALNALKKGLQDRGLKTEIDWLVEEPSVDVLAKQPFVKHLIVVKNRGWLKNLRANVKTVRFLRKRRYDLVLDFQGLLKSGVWVALSKGKRKAGFSNARELSHLFLSEKLPPYNPEKHAVERYLDLARYAGGAAEEAVFNLHATGYEKKNVEDLLEKNGIPPFEKAFFVLSTRSRWATKLWGTDKFVEFAKDVIDRYGLHAVLTGAAQDRNVLEEMRERIGEKAVNLAGMVNLRELSHLMHLSSFVVTVDSGPMHIAAASGARTVALFGPTSPARTGPFGKGHIIVRTGIDCSPCFRKSCDDPKCMKEIKVEDVLGAVEKFLDAPSRQG